MAKAFNRLKKQVQDRKVYTASPGLWARIRRMEEALFELNCYVVRVIHALPEESLSEEDKQFGQAAEEFKKHLEEVLKEDKRG